MKTNVSNAVRRHQQGKVQLWPIRYPVRVDAKLTVVLASKRLPKN